MKIQISLFGYLIMLMFYAVGTGLLTFLWLGLRRWRGWKFVITPLALVLLALPWADEVYIAWRFQESCKDAGVHVYKKVEVEGFYNDVIRGGKEQIVKYGYRFIEHRSRESKGKIVHLQRTDGEWEVSILDQPSARYHYKYSANDEDAGLQLAKEEWVIIDSKTGAILGRDTTFKRYPGWIEGLWVRFLGVYPTICRGPLDDPEKQKRLGQIYTYVLIPKN